MPYLKLPEHIRKSLKAPLGRLLRSIGDLESTDNMIICIGDKTTQEVLGIGIKPKICIYDGIIERNQVTIPDSIKEYAADEIELENPPGTINPKAFDIIQNAIESKKNHKIKVNGEEDLLALPAIDLAPKESIILYGQPGEGLIEVKPDKKTKNKVRKIIEEIKNENRNNR